jgi:hypothetical protein
VFGSKFFILVRLGAIIRRKLIYIIKILESELLLDKYFGPLGVRERKKARLRQFHFA